MNKTLLACALACAAAGPAAAATITPVNLDPPGVGLNDPAPAAPVGNNPGTTVGEQRRIVYQFAADLWGAVLVSKVEVLVEASFQTLACTATTATLGSAGAKFVFVDFPGAPLAGTLYPSALTDALAGADQFPGDNDIVSRFNANLGAPGCLEASGWYYGLDGNTPGNRINFLDVVMHEIGHGLGFQGFDNLVTGAFFAGFPNVYGSNVIDNASGQPWNALTNAGRVAAATADALAWTGSEVTDQVPVALTTLLRLAASGSLVASYGINPAAYGPFPSTANFNGAVVLVNDGAGVTSDGCEAMAAGSLSGKVALIDRGTCTFKTKSLNAQNAGATEVIIANNVAAGFPGMGDDGAIVTPITIPSVGIEQASGNAIKAALPGVNAKMQKVPGQFFGSDTAGRARLYAPAALVAGSSFSHYDISHVPNALMEPAINADLDAHLRVDLTPALYVDEGWVLNPGNARIGKCDTRVDVVEEGGIIVGANVQAWNNLCRAANPNRPGRYVQCMVDVEQRLRTAKLVTPVEGATILLCTARNLRP